ncbi:MAG: hypothetical protein PQJ58_03450 [Spirochaetales bacterium]|nr:hypothetical protein [Spirochaetales bacterium]
MSDMISRRKSRIKDFFSDGREVDVLVRSLARKLLREEKTELPPEILARISGVPEEKWIQTFSDRRSFLNDILSVPLQNAVDKLKRLDAEERNFIDKFSETLRLIYAINYNYPEVMLLFHGIAMDKKLDEKVRVNKAMNDLQQMAVNVLKKQAYEEEIVEKDSSMEKLLFFLVMQMLQTLQSRLFENCYEYMENGSFGEFPDEDEIVDSLMAPIQEQLKGITAV